MHEHHLENLYRGLHMLDYKEMCEALKLDPAKEESRAIWKQFQECDRSLRNFHQQELEAIASYFHKLKS